MSSSDAWARGLLRCPACGATLTDATAATAGALLVCEGAEPHRFPVLDGIPVLLVDEMLTDQPGNEE